MLFTKAEKNKLSEVRRKQTVMFSEQPGTLGFHPLIVQSYGMLQQQILFCISYL